MSQLKAAMSAGINDEFQAGYAAALCFAWDQAGLPATPESIALYAIAAAYRGLA